MYSDYAAKLQNALSAPVGGILEEISEILFDARNNGQNIFVFGNGGSGSLATHMAADLGKLTALDLKEGPTKISNGRLKITSLCDNSCWVTAISNDIDYRDVFLEQLKHFLEPRDVVIAISGSGSSENVVRALHYAKRRGASTIGFTGNRQSSAAMGKYCKILLSAPVQMMEQIEDLHVIYHHILARMLLEKIQCKSERSKYSCATEKLTGVD